MNLKDTYDQIAEDWHRDHQSDDWWIEGTDRFVALVGKGARVLDIGCGSGVKSKYLKEQGLDLVGIDLSPKMIDIARREVPDTEFHAMDLKEAWRLEGMFDGLFMQAVLLHVPKAEAQEQITALARKLKRGGFFYIAVKAKREGGVEEEIKTENDYGYEYQRFFSYYTLDEVKKFFENAGLKIIYENGADLDQTNWIQVIAQNPE
jgi:SAM-dependent methyltransferase